MRCTGRAVARWCVYFAQARRRARGVFSSVAGRASGDDVFCRSVARAALTLRSISSQVTVTNPGTARRSRARDPWTARWRRGSLRLPDSK